MTMRLMKEQIQMERQTGRGSGMARVEGSITLPGGLRETAKVLQCGAVVTVDRVEPLQDRAGVSGKVAFHVLYTQGDPQKVCAMEAASDFTHVLDLPGATAGCVCSVSAEAVKAAAQASGGQLTMRAEVTLTGVAVAEQAVEAVTGIADTPGLQVRSTELAVCRTAATGSGEVMLREEFELPAGLGIRETLFATARPQVTETTGGAGRAGVTGQVRLEVYHASGLADTPLVITRHVIPFAEGVDLTGEEGNRLMATATVRDVAVASQDAGEDGRTLRAEVVLGLTVRADRTEHLTVLEDAYTTEGDELRLTPQTAQCRTGACCEQAAESGKALLILDGDAPTVHSVLAAFAVPEVTDRRMAGSRLAVEGTLHITLIALPAAGTEPVRIDADEPFRQTFAVQAEADDQLRLSVTDLDASVLTGDRVELRFVMHLDLTGLRSARVRLITDAAVVPASPMDGSIVLYFVQPGEKLWDIAKRYRVSQAEIRRLNPELGEEVTAGQGVLVWRRCPASLCV